MDSLIDRFKRSIAQRGLFNTAELCLKLVLQRALPAGRRAEAERQRIDAEFDRQYGVDTGGIFRPKREGVVGANWELGGNYQAVDPKAFVKAVESVRVPHREFTFIDFGSGKGRTLLLAAGFPFRKVIGVEYSTELSDVARENTLRFPAEARKCDAIEVVNADAAEYPLPQEPLFLFLYHPFAEPVMDRVVRNVAKSFREHPRRMVVLYLLPYFAKVWERAGFLKKLQSAPALFDTGPVSPRTANAGLSLNLFLGPAGATEILQWASTAAPGLL